MRLHLCFVNSFATFFVKFQTVLENQSGLTHCIWVYLEQFDGFLRSSLDLSQPGEKFRELYAELTSYIDEASQS